MPYLEALEFEYPIWIERDGERQVQEMRQGRLENPYANYLELLRSLKHLATTASEEELEHFADCGDFSLRNPGSPRSRYALLLLQWTSGDAKPGWYDFADQAFTEFLLQDDLLLGCFDGTAYRNLDYYLTGLAELRVLAELPDDSEAIQQLWLEEGLVAFYWRTWPLRQILARACQLKGWPWFCAGAPENPLVYRNALWAQLSLQESGMSDPESLKSDLVAVHDRLVIQAQQNLEQAEIRRLRQELQEAIEAVPEL